MKPNKPAGKNNNNNNKKETPGTLRRDPSSVITSAYVPRRAFCSLLTASYTPTSDTEDRERSTCNKASQIMSIPTTARCRPRRHRCSCVPVGFKVWVLHIIIIVSIRIYSHGDFGLSFLRKPAAEEPRRLIFDRWWNVHTQLTPYTRDVKSSSGCSTKTS